MENVLRSGPFVSVNGDRAYLEQFFVDYFANFIGNGIFPVPSTALQVFSTGGLGLNVKIGNAFIKGRTHLGDNDIALTLDPGDNLLGRIDKVVLRRDKINRTITKEIKKGIPSTNPVAKSLERGDDIWELGLATIFVGKGTSTITQANITDLRLNKSECGIVTGIIDQVDTTTIFNQYEAWLSEKKLEYGNDWTSWFNLTKGQLQSNWDTWFATIQTALDGDTAGNLLNMINAIPKIYSGSTEPVGIRTGDYWFKELI